MKPTIKNLQDSYAISRDVFKDSDLEAQEVIDMYHNRQYTGEEIAVLTSRGQPVETFNIIKTFSNAISGYLDTVVNDIQVKPRYSSNPTAALLLNDTVQYVLDLNEFEPTARKVELDGMHTGKMVVYYDVVETGATDRFGRKIRHVSIEHVPAMQFRRDPMARLDDMSDSRFSHRWKWVDKEELVSKFGSRKTASLTAYSTSGPDDELTNFESIYKMRFRGKFKEWENFLVIHTIMKDGDDVYSVIWCGDTILEKKKLPYTNVRSPYRIVEVSNSDRAETYGLFREVTETQKAINQALIQIQLLINTKKAFIQENSVDDVDEFKRDFEEVNAVVVVEDLKGIQIEDLSRDVAQQYHIIDQSLQRIKTVLGVNDSFLGQAFASDSGRKVNLQQNASKSQLSPFVERVRFMYKMIGEDLVHFIQQYYNAEQIIRVSDKINGDNYKMINQAITMPTGQLDIYGMAIEDFVYDEEIDPVTGEPMEDSNGNILVTPLNDPDTSIKFVDVDIKVEAVPYNNAAEQNQLLFETFLSGPVGQDVKMVNPAGYYKIAAMQTAEFGTKNAMLISQVLAETGQMVQQGQLDPSLAMTNGDVQAINGGAMGGSNGGGPKSQQLQIPTGGN